MTAFAGRPARYPDDATSWDARADFEAGDDVVAARRREDEAALAALAARPTWLDFPDPQYGAKPTRSELADALGAALGRPRQASWRCLSACSTTITRPPPTPPST